MSLSTLLPSLRAPARQILDLVRSRAPFFEVGGYGAPILVVLAHADVLDVLQRPRDFSPAPLAQRLRATVGDYTSLPGIDGAEWVRAALPPREFARIARRIAALSDERVQAALARGPSIDAGEEYAFPAFEALFAETFGVEGPEGELVRSLLQVERYVFGSPFAEAPASVPAARAAERVNEIVAESLAAGPPENTVAGRLLARADAVTIAPLVVGVLSAAALGLRRFMGALGALFALSPEERERDVLAPARHADDAALTDALREACRLAPHPGTLLRYAEQSARLGVGTRHERLVPAGTTVACILGSAGADPSAIAGPHAFRPGRPGAAYFGLVDAETPCPFSLLPAVMPLTEVVSVQLLAVLLSAPGVHAAPGRRPRSIPPLRFVGAEAPPDHFVIGFTRPSS